MGRSRFMANQPTTSALNLLEESRNRRMPFPYRPRPALDLQADVGLNLNDLDPVAIWQDQSCIANTATQGTSGNRPTFKSTAGPGGRPCVTFDGTNDNLPLTSSITASNYTIFAVVKPTTGGPYGIISGSTNSFYYRVNSLKQQCEKTNVTNIGTSTTNLSTSAFQSIACTYDGSTLNFYLSGSADGSASNAQTISSPLTGVGRNFANGIEFFKGDLCMLRVYLYVLTHPQIAMVQAEILSRWGV